VLGRPYESDTSNKAVIIKDVKNLNIIFPDNQAALDAICYLFELFKGLNFYGFQMLS